MTRDLNSRRNSDQREERLLLEGNFDWETLIDDLSGRYVHVSCTQALRRSSSHKYGCGYVVEGFGWKMKWNESLWKKFRKSGMIL